ncbi:MAG: ATP-binding protein [Acidobacteriota bacterium]|nr:ATP-binding protein [Acidobacteriota bacterium]
MRRSRSIQFRLTVWYGLVLAGALGLFGGLIWLSLRQRLIDETDRELKSSASRFEAYFRKEAELASGNHLKGELDEFCQALPSSSYLDLRGASGFQFTHSDGRSDSSRGEPHLHVIRSSFRAGGEVFTLDVGTSMRSIHHTLELLRLLLLSLIPVAVAISCVGGAWVSRRALRPVDRITAAARTIGIENLSRRLPVPRTGDELERLTEVWNTMLVRLDSAVTTLSQFAADASHELRTPLAVIRTSAELALRRARTPESYRESLSEIVIEAERMTQLVEDLLFLARSDSRTAGMPMAPLDLRDILREVAGELRDVAELRGIRLRLLPGEVPSVVSGNGPSLRRLFLVLLDNAIKYSQAGGEVKVAVTVAAARATVTVQDFGIGIQARDLPHIFQRFYRADKARGSSGHGLGLSLAETIAQAHGASIEVRSVEAVGSMFTVAFPLRAELIADDVHPAKYLSNQPTQ